MTEKIPDPFDQAARGSDDVPVKPVQEHTEEPKIEKASVITRKVADLEQWMKVLETMAPSRTQDLAAKSLQRCKVLIRDLLSEKLDLECFATLYDRELKNFRSYTKLESIGSSAMDQNQASEETEVWLANQEEGRSIQIGVTNGKPVRMTNVVSYGSGFQMAGHMSDALLQGILCNLRSA